MESAGAEALNLTPVRGLIKVLMCFVRRSKVSDNETGPGNGLADARAAREPRPGTILGFPDGAVVAAGGEGSAAVIAEEELELEVEVAAVAVATAPAVAAFVPAAEATAVGGGGDGMVDLVSDSKNLINVVFNVSTTSRVA